MCWFGFRIAITLLLIGIGVISVGVIAGLLLNRSGLRFFRGLLRIGIPMRNSDAQEARTEGEHALLKVIFSITADNMELFKQFQDNPSFKKSARIYHFEPVSTILEYHSSDSPQS